MIELVSWFGLIVLTTILGTYVATRAWETLVAKIFVVTCGVMLFRRLFAQMERLAPTIDQSIVASFWSPILLIIFQVCLLWLIAALFIPQWLIGRNKIISYISIPYLLLALAIVVDQFIGTHFFYLGVAKATIGYQMDMSDGMGVSILLGIFLLGWCVHFGLLIYAFIRQPEYRGTIAALAVAIGLTLLIPIAAFLGSALSLPILLALAYAVISTKLIVPTRVGLDIAVQSMREAVLVLDKDEQVTFANPAAESLGIPTGLRFSGILGRAGAKMVPSETAENESILTIGKSTLQVTRTTLYNGANVSIGAILLGHDISEREEHTKQLNAERKRLDEMVVRLQKEQAEREQLAETVRALSLPVIPLWEGVLILPLVGDFNGERINEFISVLLSSIEREHARQVLIDITGLPLIDTVGAAGLLRGVRAASLLGARSILVGVRPEIAQTLVSLGITLEEITTAASLRQALQQETLIMR